MNQPQDINSLRSDLPSIKAAASETGFRTRCSFLITTIYMYLQGNSDDLCWIHLIIEALGNFRMYSSIGKMTQAQSSLKHNIPRSFCLVLILWNLISTPYNFLLVTSSLLTKKVLLEKNCSRFVGGINIILETTHKELIELLLG